ncbi:MAG: amino acid permease [Nanobdellota archaeon]
MAELKKSLGKKTIFLITVNSIMGTGIYFLPAVGARVAGPASIISWFFLSIIAVYISMCFAELTGMFPTSGGIYEFTKQAYGHFVSFLVGWIAFIAGNVTIAMLIVGAIRYLSPQQNVLWTLATPFITINITSNILISLLFIFVLNFIAYRGMKTSSFMLITFAFITLGTVFSLLIPGLKKLSGGNFTPFFVSPVSSIFVVVFLVAETFFGWETATYLAAETKDGARVMPKVLIYSTIFIAVLAMSFVVVLIGVQGFESIGASTTPLTDIAISIHGQASSTLYTILVYLAIVGAVAGWIVSAPRLLLSMAEDKLFVPGLAKIHPKFNTPYKAILFQTIITSFLILLAAGRYQMLLEILLPLLLIIYSIVILSLVILRYKMPDHPRTFKAPFGKVGPIVIILILISLVISWTFHAHEAIALIKLAFSFVLAGIPIFFLLVVYHDPDFFVSISNYFAYLNLWFEGVLLPKKILRDIDYNLGEINGKKILEFGCGVGTLTKEMVKKVGPEGFIYATDISSSSVKIAQKRIIKKGHENIKFVHDVHQINRVHDSIPSVDAVVSFGMLGYIQDIKKVLSEIHKIIPENGNIVFVDFVDLFKVLPNVNWLSHEESLANLFREAGFAVKVKKIKTPLWNYLIVHGFKTEYDVPFV